MHYFDINTEIFNVKEKYLIIALLRGCLTWKPSGLREKFIIIQNKYTSKRTIHWQNFKGEKLSRKIISNPPISGMITDGFLLKVELSNIDIGNCLWDEDTIIRRSYRLVLNKDKLKLRPDYNEIIATAVLT